MALVLPHHASKTVNSTTRNYELQQLIGLRFYNAHETTTVEEFAIPLLCGEVRCDVSSHPQFSQDLI
jgi:hypothetical protein